MNYYDDRYRNSGTEQKDSADTQVLGIVGIITAVLNLCCCGVLAVVPIALGITDILKQKKRGKKELSIYGIISLVLGTIELLTFVAVILVSVVMPLLAVGTMRGITNGINIDVPPVPLYPGLGLYN